MWTAIGPDDIDARWDRFGPEMGSIVSNASIAAASLSTGYVDSVIETTNFRPLSGETDRRQYGGTAADGRGLVPLLYGAVTETKTRTALGWETARAFEAGAAFLAAAVKSTIQDMGRMHDQVRMNAKGVREYTRVISPGACSRCAILAGTGSSAVAFLRHPNCKCIAVPTPDLNMGLDDYSSPQAYFESLTPERQDQIFTVSGAQAIRDGADINQVVNARRGSYYSGAANGTRGRLRPITIGRKADGTPLQVYATTEGTTRRGFYARQENRARANNPNYRTTTLRLMPEQIYRMAGNDPERARELLRRYGYIY